jgi:hypothetical protein
MSGTTIVRWTVRLLGVMLVVALATLLVLRVYWSKRLGSAERDLRGQLGPLVGSAFESPKIPGNDNAGIFVRAAAEALVLVGNDKAQVNDLSMTPPESWTEQQRAELRRIVADNRPALELLHRAVGLKQSVFGLAAEVDAMEKPGPLPVLLKVLSVQRLLSDDGFLALRERDIPRVLSTTDVMSVTAVALEREPILVAELVGIACEKMLLSVIASAVAKPGLDAAGISRLERAAVEVDLRVAWKQSLARVALTRLGSAASPGYRGAREIVYAVLPGCYDAPAVEYCSRLVNAVDTPYGTDLRRSAIATPFATPDLVRAAARYQVVLSQRRAARIALALRRQALETGTYPRSLSAFPEARQKDPFTGGPIVYRLRPDGSAQLTVPNGEKLWDQANPEVHNPGPFIWELPAPARTAPSTR